MKRKTRCVVCRKVFGRRRTKKFRGACSSTCAQVRVIENALKREEPEPPKKLNKPPVRFLAFDFASAEVAILQRQIQLFLEKCTS